MDYILNLAQQSQSARSVLLVPSSAKFNYFSIPPAEFCSYIKSEQATLIHPMLPRTHRLKSKSFCPLSYSSQHPLQLPPMEKQPHAWGGMAPPSARGAFHSDWFREGHVTQVVPTKMNSKTCSVTWGREVLSGS